MRATLPLSIATIITGISGLAIVALVPLLVADPSTVATFQSLWGLFFVCTGFIDGLAQEATRVLAAQPAGTSGGSGGLGASGVAGGSGSPGGVGCGGSSAVGSSAVGSTTSGVGSGGSRSRLGSGPPVPLALVGAFVGLAVLVVGLGLGLGRGLSLGLGHGLGLGLGHGLVSDSAGGGWLWWFGLASYALQAVCLGGLAGRGQWRDYALLLSVDSAVRLAWLLLAWRLGFGWWAYLMVIVLGAFSWMVLAIIRPQVRAALGTAVPRVGLFRRLVSTMGATGAQSLCVAGFAPMVLLLAMPATGVAPAALVLAALLIRAPLLLPMNKFAAVLLVDAAKGRIAGGRVVRILGAGTLAVATGCYLMGPTVFGTVWGPDYQLPGIVLAGLAVGSGFLAGLVATGAIALGRGRHTNYLAGWILAAGVSAAVLALPLAMTVTVPLALIAGPAVGMIVHQLR